MTIDSKELNETFELVNLIKWNRWEVQKLNEESAIESYFPLATEATAVIAELAVKNPDKIQVDFEWNPIRSGEDPRATAYPIADKDSLKAILETGVHPKYEGKLNPNIKHPTQFDYNSLIKFTNKETGQEVRFPVPKLNREILSKLSEVIVDFKPRSFNDSREMESSETPENDMERINQLVNSDNSLLDTKNLVAATLRTARSVFDKELGKDQYFEALDYNAAKQILGDTDDDKHRREYYEQNQPQANLGKVSMQLTQDIINLKREIGKSVGNPDLSIPSGANGSAAIIQTSAGVANNGQVKAV